MAFMFPLMRHPNKRATWGGGGAKILAFVFPLMRHPNKRATANVYRRGPQ